ncbi:MAG: NAD(+) kinase [Porticoccaceae bacterium]
MTDFNRIALVANIELPEIGDFINQLIDFLTRGGYSVLLEANTARFTGNTSLPVFEYSKLDPELDLVIVVGGDGSMLSAARSLVRHNVPLLGVNRGRLGFLTDILPREMESQVLRVLKGEYILSSRFLLEVSISRGGQEIGRGDALNDVVLHPGKSVRMMEFELYIDNQFVYSQRSDGLIVSTPTGSTAYALSGGGPIMHPNLDAIVLVPMNPHTLTSRPIVVGGNSDIEIRVGTRNELHPQVTCDGQNDLQSEPGDIIRIHKKAQPIQLIHPVGHNFYETCRTKLGWGSRLGATEQDS